jgi:hypothetical protein
MRTKIPQISDALSKILGMGHLKHDQFFRLCLLINRSMVKAWDKLLSQGYSHCHTDHENMAHSMEVALFDDLEQPRLIKPLQGIRQWI